MVGTREQRVLMLKVFASPARLDAALGRALLLLGRRQHDKVALAWTVLLLTGSALALGLV